MGDQSIEPVMLARFTTRHEAEMALGVLQDAGLAAAVRSDDGGSTEPALTWQGRAWLWVAGDQADAARELLADAGFLEDHLSE